MTRLGTILATVVMGLLPKLAVATTYDFSATETSALSPSPVSFTFALDTATAISGANGTTFPDVTITENGTAVMGNGVGASYTTYLSSPLFFLIDTSATPFYSGAGSAVAFNVGTFAIADGATDGEGSLTITEAGNSAVPEPATWGMLFVGGLLVPVVLRDGGVVKTF